MMPIHELLSKIKWDVRERGHKFTIFYRDRLKRELQHLDFDEILSIEDGVMMVLGNRLSRSEKKNAAFAIGNREIMPIPLHRVRKVTKYDKVIWSRIKGKVY